LSQSEEKKVHKIFVYGVLKKSTPSTFEISRYLNQKPFRKATIVGQIFLLPSNNATCFPAVEIENIDKDLVQGEVVEFEEDELLSILDAIEGVNKEGSMYDRVQVLATYEDGTSEEVWVYVWVDDPDLLQFRIEHGNFEVYGFQEQTGKYRKGYPLQDPNSGEPYLAFIEQDEGFCLTKVASHKKNDTKENPESNIV